MPTESISLRAIDSIRDELDDYFDFLAPTAYVPHPSVLESLIEAAESRSEGTLVGFAHELAALIHERLRYEKGATHVHSTVLDSLAAAAGVRSKVA